MKMKFKCVFSLQSQRQQCPLPFGAYLWGNLMAAKPQKSSLSAWQRDSVPLLGHRRHNTDWLAAFKNLLPSGLLGGRNGREKGKAGKLANGKCQMQ